MRGVTCSHHTRNTIDITGKAHAATDNPTLALALPVVVPVVVPIVYPPTGGRNNNDNNDNPQAGTNKYQ